VSVPIPSGLLVREARLDNKLVSLMPAPASKGDSRLSALLSHPGRSVLSLDIALPVTPAAGTESIALPSADSGVTRASVELPRQGVDVQLEADFVENQNAAPTAVGRLMGGAMEATETSRGAETEDHAARNLCRSLTELGQPGDVYLSRESDSRRMREAVHSTTVALACRSRHQRHSLLSNRALVPEVPKGMGNHHPSSARRP